MPAPDSTLTEPELKSASTWTVDLAPVGPPTDEASPAIDRPAAEVDESTSRWSIGNRWGLAVATVVFMAAALGTATRIVRDYGPPGPFDESHQGLCDFHNGLYFPSRALAAGISPYGYDYADNYPVSRPIPFYSPSVLVLHLPLTLLPLGVAEVVWVAFCYGLILAMAGFLVHIATPRGSPRRLDAVVGLAALIACSRGGHITVYNGYFTLELIFASLAAIWYADRHPNLSAVGLAIAAIKPTFILPLGLLMLARGNTNAIVRGAILTIVVTFGPLLFLAHHAGGGDLVAGGRELLAQIQTTQEIHRAVQSESPVYSWTRIDALALVAKWMGGDPPQWIYLVTMVGLCVPAMAALDRRRREGVDDGLLGVTGWIIVATTLVSIYHQFYDALLLLGPWVGLFVAWRTGVVRQRHQAWLLVLAVFPLFNFLTARFIVSQFPPSSLAGGLLTSVNALALLAIWAISIRSGFSIQNNRIGGRRSFEFE